MAAKTKALARAYSPQEYAELAKLYAAPTQDAGMSDRDLAEMFSERTPPVYSVGQGLAEAGGKIGEAYFRKQAREKAQASQASDSHALAQAMMGATSPMSVHDAQVSQGNYQLAKDAFPNGQTSNASVDPQAMQPYQPAQPAFDNSAAPDNMKLAALMQGVPDKLKLEALPAIQQQIAATKPKAFTGELGADQAAFIDGKQVATGPKKTETQTPHTVTTDAGVFSQNPDGSLGVRLGNRPAPDKEPKTPQTKFAFDRKINKNRSVSPDEEVAEPERFAPPIAAPQVKAYDKNGNEAGTFDANDPSLKPRLDSGELTTQAPKQQTDQEKRSMGFANRMKNAEGDLTAIYAPKKEGGSPTLPGQGLWGNVENTRIPLTTSSIVPQALQTSAFERERRAKMEWMSAALRKDSGATIQPSEYADMDKIYFPQPGEGPQIIADKAKARTNFMSGIEAESRPGNQAILTTGSPPEGVDPAIWSHMTPEEKSLWAK